MLIPNCSQFSSKTIQNGRSISFVSILIFFSSILMVACVDKSTVEATNTAIQNYNTAKKKYLENPNDPDALIWYGRRAAYLGQFEEAINTYTEGIRLHPQDARMLRHRGHRYISTRLLIKKFNFELIFNQLHRS